MPKAPEQVEKTQTPDRITVTVDNVEREIFLSFGLLNALTIVVNDPARVASIPVVPEVREAVLNTLLAKRKPNGKLEEPVDVNDLDISIEDVERLLTWASEHVMDFFIRSLRKVMETTAHHQKDLTALASFLGGSKNLASETQ